MVNGPVNIQFELGHIELFIASIKIDYSSLLLNLVIAREFIKNE